MITIVDYGAGNLTSVYNAFLRLGIKSEITSEPEKVAKAKRIVFPGVGAAKAAMENLKSRGLDLALNSALNNGIPILGICIGCQIILQESEEDGGIKCLGFLQGKAVRFKNEADIKIPHIGWNQVEFGKDCRIFKDIPNNSDFYFVHSYYPSVNADFVYASTTYGSQTFPCVIGHKNLLATQFHLEKSGEIGLQVLKNFASSVL